VDNKFFINNRKKLIESMNDDSLVVLFSGTTKHKSADELFDFAVNKNFYYMTGIERENFILFLSKKDGEVKETLFIEKVTELEEKWTGKRMTEGEAKEISGVTNMIDGTAPHIVDPKNPGAVDENIHPLGIFSTSMRLAEVA